VKRGHQKFDLFRHSLCAYQPDDTIQDKTAVHWDTNPIRKEVRETIIGYQMEAH